MEAASKMLRVGAVLEAPIAEPDPEMLLFVEEVGAELPQGDALGMAEARADYLLERIAKERQRIDRIKAAADARVKMIRDHADAEAETHRKRIDYLESRVRENLPGDARRFREIYGKKSVRLAHGTVGFRSSRATVVIVDEAKAVAFAKAQGYPVKLIEAIGKTPLIEHVTRTGEEPDPETAGFQYVPPADAFYVEPDLEF